MRATAFGSLVLTLLAVGRIAHAEAWQATTQLTPSSPSSCPKASFTYQLSLEGTNFRGTTPAGGSFESVVSADGTVSAEHRSAPQVGLVRITGNARSRQLSLTASELRACQYALVSPAAAAAAMPSGQPMQRGAEWALGRWEGHVYKPGTSAGTVGLRSEPRALIVRKSPDGTVACNWSEPQFVSGIAAQSCKIDGDTISLVTGSSTIVELKRSGPDSLVGTFRNQDWDRNNFHAQVSMKRSR